MSNEIFWSEKHLPRLRNIARSLLQQERPNHTLQPTELVSEIYLRMHHIRLPWQGMDHFFSFAVRTMRRVLIDHSRSRASDRRGKNPPKVTLGIAEQIGQNMGIARRAELKDLLEKLSVQDPQTATILVMRTHQGLQVMEIAERLGVSDMTVKRRWKLGKAWLLDKLSDEPLSA